MNKFVRIFVVCSIIFVALAVTSCANPIYKIIYFKEIINIEEQIVKDNDKVLSVNVLDDTADYFRERRLEILINFKDGQNILLTNVGQKYILIQGINGYSPYFFRKTDDDKVFIVDSIRIDFPTDDIIKNINRIIRVFDVMVTYMESLEDIDSDKYRDKSREWFWSDEANLEKKTTGNRNWFWSDESNLVKETTGKEQIEFKEKLEKGWIFWTSGTPYIEAKEKVKKSYKTSKKEGKE